MKPADPSVSHSTFNRTTVWVSFVLFVAILAAVAGGALLDGEESAKSALNLFLDWLTIILPGSLFGWLIYRGLIARPDCPSCHSNNVRLSNDGPAEGIPSHSLAKWKYYRCNRCGTEFRIATARIQR